MYPKLLLASCLILSNVGLAQAQPAARPRFVPNRLIVVYNSAQDADAALREMQSNSSPPGVRGSPVDELVVTKGGSDRLSIKFNWPDGVAQGVRGNPGSELDLLEALAKDLKDNDPRVRYAGPVYLDDNPDTKSDSGTTFDMKGIRSEAAPSAAPAPLTPPARGNSFVIGKDGPIPRSAGMPNDSFMKFQWDLLPTPTGMNTVGAWKVTKGDPAVVVAVIDTGVVRQHQDIRDGRVLAGVNTVSSRYREVCPDEPLFGADASDPGTDRAGCPQNPGRKPDEPFSPSFHGTHVTGTIGARTDNGVGIAAVAPNVTVLPIRALTTGGGTDGDISDAIRWAAGLHVDGLPNNPRPADIISMSLSGPRTKGDGTFQSCGPGGVDSIYIGVIAEARRAGTVVVVSAGNGYPINGAGKLCELGTPGCSDKPVDVKYEFPAGCPGVISVAASDRFGHIAPYSNYGNVSIMAPGGNMRDGGDIMADGNVEYAKKPFGDIFSSSSALDGKGEKIVGVDLYSWKQGTSMAAPHVSGAIALLLSARPDLRRKPDLIEQALRAAAVKPPAGGCPPATPCGPGLLDAGLLVSSKPAAAR